MPEPWALCAIDTEALARLQAEAGRLRARLAEQALLLREYATGGRHSVELTDGSRYVYRDGQLQADTRPLRRTAAVQAG